MKLLETLAKLCAIFAGMLLIAITLMTCASVIGRETVGKTLTGDFELTGALAGSAIAMFMPWCQFKRGNIMVDFFTTKASQQTQVVMERFGAFLLAVIMGVMAWRTTLGGINAYQAHSGTMILDLPIYYVYVCIAPPLLLTALIALSQSIFGFGMDSGTEKNAELSV